MKKYLIPHEGNFYKANLHTHTTISDGRQTPEEVKAMYKSQGYSVVAFTDHEAFIPHNDLTDEDFLAMNGVEIGIGHINPEAWDWHQNKACDIGLIALDKDIVNHPVWHRTMYRSCVKPEVRAQVRFDESLPDFVREYSTENISEMMRRGKDAGFFVVHNHPTGYMQVYPDYIGYENFHALEMYNHGGFTVDGVFEYNPSRYDEYLRAGKRIYCIYTDDSHQVLDACGGWVMIKADRLDYPTIAKALVDGNFYSSRGPVIYDLWYEDKKVHITFPRAARVVLYTDTIRCEQKRAPEGIPTAWNEAVFTIEGYEKCFRITVYDEMGNTADTNAYFLDELDECFKR